MKNSTIFRVIILGAVAIVGIIGMQAYWVLSTWNINEEEFNKKASLALYRVACDLVELSGGELPARNIVNQRTSNSYVVNIESEIDEEHLEYFLQKELERLALYVDFEYAVYDCTTNEMVYGNYCSFKPHEPINEAKLGDLPKDDKFTYYFSVKFPNRSGYLFGRMQLSIVFSILLLVVILFFSYSMYVILRQKRLSELQKDFINNMTHEFKTPISTIRIAADVFAGADEVQSDKRLNRYAGILKEQNQRLNHQVEKVLQLAHIDQGSFELKKEPFELDSLLNRIVDSTAVRVEKQGGTLISHIDTAGVVLQADRLHFTNILHNLLDNAIKYCKDQPRINFRATVDERQVRVQIADEGIGISKEYLNRVFNKFYRIPTGNIHNVKGFGLGLYYVKSICDAHGWSLLLNSKQGQGTTVDLLIPLAQASLWQRFQRWSRRKIKHFSTQIADPA
ncbi:MAG TPA: HAMP domain-containing sensor histidine kinase [Phaeodactylibacter sp.]|nr:HAMP domain-containing sensor histidine kinase [Phaeodactylibacter sp.]